MHPIEALRYVARASGTDASLLVQEAASALAFFGDDSAGLLTGARRLLTRQPAIGPLWALSARMAVSIDPRAEARQVILDHRNDPTSGVIAAAIPDGATVVIAGWPDQTVQGLLRRGDIEVLVVDVEGQARPVLSRLDRADVVAEGIDPAHVAGAVEAADLVIIETAATGDSAALVETAGLTLAAVARITHTPVWLVAGEGRRLPEPYWQAIIERISEPDLPSWLTSTEIVGFGLVDRVVTPLGVQLVAELAPTTCPMAAELLRPAI